MPTSDNFAHHTKNVAGQPVALGHYELGILVQASAPKGRYISPEKQGSRCREADALVAHGFLLTGAAKTRYLISPLGEQVLADLKASNTDAYTHVVDVWRLY